MTKLLVGQSDFVGFWVSKQLGSVWFPGRAQAIGVIDSQDRLIAGFVYDSWNKASLYMHIAALPGKRWATHPVLAVMFDYPFRQLGCQKILAVIGEKNTASRRFTEHVGFKLEATLSKAHPDGDLLVYTLTPEDCRWLSLPIEDSYFGRHIQTGPAAAT